MKEKDLIELLQELRDKGLTRDFCNNEDNSYKGNYDNAYLSRILNNKNPYKHSSHFERCIIEDIAKFLKAQSKK